MVEGYTGEGWPGKVFTSRLISCSQGQTQPRDGVVHFGQAAPLHYSNNPSLRVAGFDDEHEYDRGW
jgi:hypothetical protein